MIIRPWKCRRGHVMGHVKNERLYVYQKAIPSDTNEVGVVIGEVTGESTWTCSICGAKRKWSYRDEEAVVMLQS